MAVFEEWGEFRAVKSLTWPLARSQILFEPDSS